jgi:hypothetical protein
MQQQDAATLKASLSGLLWKPKFREHMIVRKFDFAFPFVGIAAIEDRSRTKANEQ